MTKLSMLVVAVGMGSFLLSAYGFQHRVARENAKSQFWLLPAGGAGSLHDLRALTRLNRLFGIGGMAISLAVVALGLLHHLGH